MGTSAGLSNIGDSVNETGFFNTFIGDHAGYNNTLGSDNTFIGYNAGRYNIGHVEAGDDWTIRTGFFNTFIGSRAGYNNTQGANNTFTGNRAGNNNTTGSGNTFIGSSAGVSNTSGSGNVFIGNNAGFDETGSDRLYITNSTSTLREPLIYGEFDNRLLVINGTTRTEVLQITGGSDIAEPFEVTGTTIEPGMVVAIDAQRPGQLRIADRGYDRTVAGIISGAGGVQPGLTLQQENTLADGAYPVAMSGRVYCRVDASHGPIVPGDLLTTSDTPGYAMKVTEYERAHGAIIGKAMTGLEQGKDLVLVLVTLQ